MIVIQGRKRWDSRGGVFAKVAVRLAYQLDLGKTSFVEWRYFIHCWRGGVNSNHTTHNDETCTVTLVRTCGFQ